MEYYLSEQSGKEKAGVLHTDGNGGDRTVPRGYVLHPPIGTTRSINDRDDTDSAVQIVGKAVQKFVDQTTIIITGYDRAQKSLRSGESQVTGGSFQILHRKLSLTLKLLTGLFPQAQGILTRLLGKRIPQALAFLLRLGENAIRLPVRLG